LIRAACQTTHIMSSYPALKWFAAAAAWILAVATAQAAVFEIIALPDTENYLESRPG